MNEPMYKITIITRKEKFEELRTALIGIGVRGMTVSEVEGCGVQKGKVLQVRGIKKEVHLVEKLKVEIVVCTVPVETVLDTVQKVLKTGEIGDGKVFVSEVSQVIRIRTGEADKEALRNPDE